MTKARTLADFNASGVLTSASSLNASKLLSGTIPNDRYGTPTFDGSNITSLTSGNLTGALPAISGASLTGIDAGGALVQTGRTVLSSNETDITVDNCFTSEYENYLVILSDLNCTVDSQALRLRFRTGGSSGATDNGSQYRYACRYFDDDGTASSNTGFGQQQAQIAKNSEEDGDWKGYNGQFTVYQPYLNTSTRMTGNGSFIENNKTDVVSSHAAIHYDSPAIHTGLRLYYSSGGIRSGASITVFGIKTT